MKFKVQKLNLESDFGIFQKKLMKNLLCELETMTTFSNKAHSSLQFQIQMNDKRS